MVGRKIVLLAFGKRMWMGRAWSCKLVRRMLRILNIYIITTAGGYGSGHRPRDDELRPVILILEGTKGGKRARDSDGIHPVRSSLISLCFCVGDHRCVFRCTAWIFSQTGLTPALAENQIPLIAFDSPAGVGPAQSQLDPSPVALVPDHDPRGSLVGISFCICYLV